MTNITNILAIFLYSVSFGSISLFSQPGTLDFGFGTGGIVTTAVGDTMDAVYDMVIQSDGKILVAGYSLNGVDRDFALARYNINGSLDATFNSDGKVVTDIGSLNDIILSLTLQTDGKILVVGQTGSSGLPPSYNLAMVRYNSDGSLDNTFGSGGIVITSVGPNGGVGHDVLQLSDGKILVAGYYDAFDYDYSFALLRYNSDGGLDNSFDSDGIAVTTIGNDTQDVARSMVIQSDGKILLAGSCLHSGQFDYAMVRFNSDGSLDNTFDADGMVRLDLGSSNDIGRAVVVLADGKIVVAGNGTGGIDLSDFALVRCNGDGSLDTTFNGNGFALADFADAHDYCRSITLQPDGKIFAAGYALNDSTFDFAMARFNIDGSLDNTFGLGGLLTTAIDISTDYGYSCSIQSDGKFLVAGTSRIGLHWLFSLARYNGGTIGIDDESETKFYLFPNPVGDECNIQLKEAVTNVRTMVTNSLGQQIFESVINGSAIKLDTRNRSKGLYFIRVEGLGTHQLIKQ